MNVLSAMAEWVVAALVGAAATSVTVLAVSAAGLLMLGGRVPIRRGAMIVLGCFVLFSASTIAAALTSAVEPAPSVDAAQPVVETLLPPAPAPAAQTYDPYGGVAVPGRSMAGARDLP